MCCNWNRKPENFWKFCDSSHTPLSYWHFFSTLFACRKLRACVSWLCFVMLRSDVHTHLHMFIYNNRSACLHAGIMYRKWYEQEFAWRCNRFVQVSAVYLRSNLQFFPSALFCFGCLVLVLLLHYNSFGRFLWLWLGKC